LGWELATVGEPTAGKKAMPLLEGTDDDIVFHTPHPSTVCIKTIFIDLMLASHIVLNLKAIGRALF
jgi:hypothetical protein